MYRRWTASLAFSGVLLAGCSPSGEPQDSAPTAAPGPSVSALPEGEQFTGNGYTFKAPQGWTRTGAPRPEVDLLVMNQNDTADGFRDNVNVISNPAQPGAFDLNALESSMISQLAEQKISSDMTARPRVLLDGRQTIVIQGTSAQGTPRTLRQLATIRNGRSYVISVTSNKTTDPATFDAECATIVNSWRWTG